MWVAFYWCQISLFFGKMKQKLWVQLDKYQTYFKPYLAYSLNSESFIAWLGDSGLAFLAVVDLC